MRFGLRAGMGYREVEGNEFEDHVHAATETILVFGLNQPEV